MVKTGRPKTDKPSSYTLRTRVDEDMYNQVQKYCNDNKISQSEFLRGLVEEKLEDKQYEQVEKKVMYKDSGNNWQTVQIVLPIGWVNDMEITRKSKDVALFYDKENKKIIIKKSK